MAKEKNSALSGETLGEGEEISLDQLCHACAQHTETVVAMVEEGILKPVAADAIHWRFTATSIRRVRTAVRLQRDLEVNLAGAALALQLMDRIERLRTKLRRLEGRDRPGL
jgi:chaperone modulatory protein CbpM